MKTTLPASFLLCALFLLNACRTTLNDTTDVVVSIEPEFTIDLYEQRDPLDGHAQFGLWVESAAVFDCANYAIESITSMQGNNITVQIVDVRKPAICDGVTATARKFIPIGQLADGNYRLTISLGSDGLIKNTGTLTVDQSQYAFSVSDPQGIDFQNTTLRRLPDGALWGYISRPNEVDVTLANAFLTDLKNATAEANLLPGYYGYFTLGGAGTSTLHKSVDIPGIKEIFIRRLNNQPDAVQHVLQNYRTGSKPLQIRCWTTLGEL